MSINVADAPLTLASEPASRGQLILAAMTTGFVLVATLILVPFASRPGPVIPGFLLLNQMGLLLAYALGSWVLYAQFHRGRSLSLLLSAAASLFTAGMMVLQLASFPGVFGPGSTRLLGDGPETTTWLWTFWHAGPPALGLAYAATIRRERAASFRRERASLAMGVSLAATLLLIAVFGAVSTVLLPWLPQQTHGDNYSAFVTSGVGPGLMAFTLVALAALWRKTRSNRTVLELWLAVSLVLLALDSILTQLGGMRGSVGWYAGRVGALISALAVLWAYLHEVNATHTRAELAAATHRLHVETSLLQSRKMEAIGHLTSGIAHDFNNLLQVMSSMFNLIARHPGDLGQTVKVTEVGLRSIAKGEALTARLLLFSRRRMLSQERVNPNTVLTDFEPVLAHAVPKTIGVELQLDPHLRCVILDSVEFETAVLNLVVNACHALKGVEGRIVVATKTDILSPNTALTGCGPDDLALEAGEYAVVSVADNGTGMPKAVAAHAFDPFFTTKEPGKGTGLGLSQVHAFAQSSRGSARLVTGPGGTKIEIWLPYAPAEDDNAEHAQVVVSDAMK